jgi:hypothetical protein
MADFSFESSEVLVRGLGFCHPGWTGGCLNTFLFKDVLVLQLLDLFLAPI